jgi:uncharacterized protein
VDTSKLAGYLTAKRLELIILPTENCNFRCTYCYEDFEIGQMKDNTVQAIKHLIQNRLSKLKRFHISWFGGEPLLAKKLVLDLSRFAQEHCNAAGVEFSSFMTTNAFALTPELFADLVKADVRGYQISIDGNADAHDQTRKLISGRGTFERIWANLLALRESSEQFLINLRIHVHTQNIDSLRSLMPKLYADFGNDRRFSILLHAVGNWGGESVKSMQLIKSSDEIITELDNTLKQLGWYANRSDVAESSDMTEGVGAEGKRVSPCYAARPNSFVIRADGRLAKCTVAFNDPRNVVGHINDDGTLQINNERVRGFMRGFQSLDEGELHCPMHNFPGTKEAASEVKVIQFQKREQQELESVA